MSDEGGSLPTEPFGLARWFAEGVRSELAALEKTGGDQRYELLSGEAIDGSVPANVLRFVIADGTRLPEDSSGLLKSEAGDFNATVISQEANRIHLYLEGQGPLPHRIPRATLTIDDTALLRRLADALERTEQELGPKSLHPFHPARARVGFAALPATPTLNEVTGETRRTLEQALGSDLTYLWGPPGTGKTYAIAHLVEALLERGERVLVTSHTHAAVDAALYEALSGPLADHSEVNEGRVLRIGQTADTKIPDSVKLDKLVETRAAGLSQRIAQLEAEARPLSERRSLCRAALAEWQKLAELTARRVETQERAETAEGHRLKAEREGQASSSSLAEARSALEKAQGAWFRRSSRVLRAGRALTSREDDLRAAERRIDEAEEEGAEVKRLLGHLESAIAEQRAVCEALTNETELSKELAGLDSGLAQMEREINRLRDEIGNLVERLMGEARAVFATLTKLYTGKETEGQQFDAVVVDEISMALPPLVFLASARANTRLVLVGDFLQLPPIVRSDDPISSERLAKDLFHLSGVARDNKPSDRAPVLASLKVQRRMVPSIADLARHLAYGPDGIEDHRSVLDREPAVAVDFLPGEPLIIVDTSELGCWSGKQPGSLSRFNFYTATLSVELAAMIAAGTPAPKRGQRPPIGLITPYAAQRRLASRLVEELKLSDWVAVGTIHTFQGSQADVMIFDSVLDEPYYSARLCDPKAWGDVIRQLNVAVTRAKDRLLLVGSSRWLDRHAKGGSGLGHMWSFLKERAVSVHAEELVGEAFAERVSRTARDPQVWRVPQGSDGPTLEVLDEETFYERFAQDLSSAREQIFGLAPYFGEYRWPRVQPFFEAALARGVEVTLVTSDPAEAKNRGYVDMVQEHLRSRGAVVISSWGLHGKDILIDERIHYTGSLNWASHRGRSEIMHRTESPAQARLVLRFLQAKHIRGAAVHEDGTPRTCPECGGATRVVNQRRQRARWDLQAMKVGCANEDCRGYLRNIDERAPLRFTPRCKIDGRTQYRRVRRGRGERWQCPTHPRDCPSEKVVPGDPP